MLTFVLLVLAATANKIVTAKIECEKIDHLGTFQKCCYFNTIVINATDVEIAGPKNTEVDGILFAYNKNAQFLPVNVYRNFPNLEYFTARAATITNISGVNFDRLARLELLDLRENQIQSVPNDCFENLYQLREILLSKQPTLASSYLINYFMTQMTTKYRK